MALKNIPNKTIDDIVKFIDDNDLGPIKVFYFDDTKDKRVYSDIEKQRLDNALNIFSDIINGKIPTSEAEKNLKEKLSISDDIAKNFYKTIRESLSEASEVSVENPEQPENKTNTDSRQEGGKSIFSVLIK